MCSQPFLEPKVIFSESDNQKWFLVTGPGTEVVANISEGYFLVENEKCAKDEVD